MTKTTSMERRENSLLRDWLLLIRYRLGGGRILLVLVAAAVIGGMALNWNWLVATGLASLLLALAPCAAMCGLGLCMHLRRQQSDGSARHDATPASEDGEGDRSVISSKMRDCCNGGRAEEAAKPQAKGNERRDSDD
jgi:hypothetical protein